MERATGIEPVSAGWEPTVLPIAPRALEDQVVKELGDRCRTRTCQGRFWRPATALRIGHKNWVA